ncbi:hypothetical protein [uncultured Eubacterium sp.]|uniref:hypothetical protein n=1 Tax=uncultured Eubacterium sp. TaxID=165185 RepID=UPI002672FC41|nr:hypothetical protein [uncultured Eubacterium sp.]
MKIFYYLLKGNKEKYKRWFVYLNIFLVMQVTIASLLLNLINQLDYICEENSMYINIYPEQKEENTVYSFQEGVISIKENSCDVGILYNHSNRMRKWNIVKGTHRGKGLGVSINIAKKMNLDVGNIISVSDADENEFIHEINYIFEGYIPDFLGEEIDKNSGIILIHKELSNQLKIDTAKMKKMSYSNSEDREAYETLSPKKRFKIIDKILFMGNAKIYILVSIIGIFLILICVCAEITQLIKEKYISMMVYRAIGLNRTNILICYLIYCFQFFGVVLLSSVVISNYAIDYILKLFRSEMYHALLLVFFIISFLLSIVLIKYEASKMEEE